MKNKSVSKRIVSFLTITAVLVLNFYCMSSTVFSLKSDVQTDSIILQNQSDINTNTGFVAATDEIQLSVDNAELKNGAEIQKKVGESEGLFAVLKESSSSAWQFQAEGGKYNVTVTYCTVNTGNTNLEFSVKVDGEYPNDASRHLELTRCYSDDGEYKADIQGNSIRPAEKEVFEFQTVVLKQTDSYTEELFDFSLTEGKHSFEISAVYGEFSIQNIVLSSVKENSDYETVSSTYRAPKAEKVFNVVQAEEYSLKSDNSILTQNDRTSAATQPNHPYLIIYNSVGGDTWNDAGQWIEWKIIVEEDGLYNIGSRFKQSTKIGSYSSRKLTIDGKIPFKEAESINFDYDSSWQTSYFGNENPYLFYLEKGEHTIRLEATNGDFSEYLTKTADIVNRLNSLYLEIIMITGSSPDLERDYNFTAQIPEAIAEFKTLYEEIDNLAKDISALNIKVSELERAFDTLKKMNEEPETIAKRLSNFQSNISSLASWLSDCRRQPLLLDYIFVSSPEQELPEVKSGFFDSAVFHLKQLLGTYIMDYTTVGSLSQKGEEQKQITVWMTCGTEQANIIQKMINEDFTPQTGISVKAQNVSLGALMPAILANRAPDAMLNMDEATPVNYALRGAIYDLSKFDNIDAVLSQFDACTYESFCFQDSIYALPLTVDYPVLFVRTDVAKQLNITDADLSGWDTILQVVLPKIQTKNLYFGLTPSMNSYLMFYYQRGGNLYDAEIDHILLDTPTATDAFETYSEIFSDYKQKLTFSFANLFRSGEMPIAVMPYSQYFQLAVFAPEIENYWKILPVPFTETDGAENRSCACTVTGAAIMAATKDADSSFEFLIWFTGEKAQTKYAADAETVLGIAGRVNTANNAARETLGWRSDAKQVLDTQLKSCRGVPQVPGSYYASRYFDFAFRDVIYSGVTVVEACNSAAEDINAEIDDKKIELLK